jgi:hypothetical protein
VTPRERLDQIADVKRWFVRSRGSGAMVNGCDCRLAFDTPSAPAGDCKLVVGGYRRMRGSFPLVRLTRELDPEGDVQGYRRLCGLALLKPTWKATYAALPVEFRFKDAKALLRDSSDETASFVKACVAAGVLRHDPAVPPKGLYRKILPGSSTVPPAVQTGDHADFAATVQ